MWRRVALCSKDQLEQLLAYQNAIEALTVSMTLVLYLSVINIYELRGLSQVSISHVSWRSGRVLDSGSIGCNFNPQWDHCFNSLTALGKLLTTHMATLDPGVNG